MGKDLKGKELGKGITQRKDGRYYARFINRFGKRDGVYASTLKEVKAELAKAVETDIRRKNVVDEKITLNEWYEKWMEIYKAPIIRPNTKRHYSHIYTSKIAPVLGNEKLSAITKLQVTSLINDVCNEGYQWETLNKIKILLIDMFDRALEDDFIIKNPARGVRLPKNRPMNHVKVLTKEEQEEFLECASGTFYYNLFSVAIFSGLRPGELFALTEKDIDFDNKEICVSKTLVYQKYEGDTQKVFHMEEPKTKSSYRRIPMNFITEKALYKQIKQHKVVMARTPYKDKLEFPDLLFTTKLGTPLNSVLYSAAIDKIVNEINLTRDNLDLMEKFSGHERVIIRTS